MSVIELVEIRPDLPMIERPLIPRSQTQGLLHE